MASLPAGWEMMDRPRHYVKKFGPLVVKGFYDTESGSFKFRLVAGFDTVIQTINMEWNAEAEENDPKLLRLVTVQVRVLLRKWAK